MSCGSLVSRRGDVCGWKARLTVFLEIGEVALSWLSRCCCLRWRSSCLILSWCETEATSFSSSMLFFGVASSAAVTGA